MSPLLAIVLRSLFSVDGLKVFVIDAISVGDHPLVEIVVAGLARTDEQDRRPTRIEGVEDPIRIAPAWTLSSRMFPCFEPRISELCGNGNVGPRASKS
jgi:hypothetical protein